MRTILKTMAAAYFAMVITACALLAPLGKDDEARRAAKVTLAAYETTQQAILIYGRLPTCDPAAEVIRLCKDRELWAKIKCCLRRRGCPAATHRQAAGQSCAF